MHGYQNMVYHLLVLHPSSPPPPSLYIAVGTDQPQLKKPRIARRSNFLASDSEQEEQDIASKGETLDEGGREEGEKMGVKNPRKLALDSSDSSSDSGGESDDSASSGGQSSGVNLSQDGSNCVNLYQNITTDIASPVMDTADLLVDTCVDPAKDDSRSQMTDSCDTGDTADHKTDVEMTPVD